MTATRPLTYLCRIAGIVLVALALLAATGGSPASADDDVNLCPADRPCVTEFFVKTSGVLFVRWSGGWEWYNIELRAPGELIKEYDLEGSTFGWTLNPGAWNRTYTLIIQGCNSKGFLGLGGSDCTPWAERRITLRAPDAPENVRLDGDTVRFDRVDSRAFHVQLWGTQKSDGETVWITSSGHVDSARSLTLPAGWRDRFTAIEVCASNPAGRTCTPVQIRIIAQPKVEPKLPPAPPTPAGFKGERDGGFGTRIILSWNDVSGEAYYFLTAFSAQTGEPVAFPLSAPAPKLGADSTTFIDSGQITALVGGVEFRLQACSAGGCSKPATAVVE
jgi:hypothetical protein